MNKQRTGSSKPSSAPSKNRIRSQSPIDGPNVVASGVMNSAAPQAGFGGSKKNLATANFGNTNAQGRIMSSTVGFQGMMQG